MTLAGRRHVGARDGDKKQARRRVNHLVAIGVFVRPELVPCVDCGHIGNDRKHEYDHFLGYGAEHHEHIHALCKPCHVARSRGSVSPNVHNAPLQPRTDKIRTDIHCGNCGKRGHNVQTCRNISP